MRVGWAGPFFCAACVVLCGTGAYAQAKPSAAIPATAPTTSFSDLPSAQPGASYAAPRESSRITWTGSQLTIDGRGDDLRSILLQVARETGMKVTGGIPEERVFGIYGPANVQDVLAQLFDGIPINMMLLNASPTQPKELILTARTGGVTPPMAQPINDDERRVNGRGFGPQRGRPMPPPPSLPQAQAPPPPPSGASPAGAPNAAAPNATQTDNGTANTGNNTDASGQPQSPNGVRTPEQIFEELRKRQQQQQGAAGSNK